MSGQCERPEGCVCGGDTQYVREHCRNWVKKLRYLKDGTQLEYRTVEVFAEAKAPNEFIDCKVDAQLEACNFCLAQATEARADMARMQHDIQAIITKFQAGHLGYIGFVEAVAALPYFKKDKRP